MKNNSFEMRNTHLHVDIKYISLFRNHLKIIHYNTVFQFFSLSGKHYKIAGTLY